MAIADTVPERTVGVAFSGGVDSSLLAMLCIKASKQVMLLTVGFEGSHDLAFSPQISSILNVSHRTAILSDQEFHNDVNAVRSLVGCGNTSHIENCIAFRAIARLARQNNLDLVLSANGIDELYCGYNGYRLVYDRGQQALEDLMDEKIRNELELVSEMTLATKEYGVSIRQPFLSESFIRFSKQIPIADKITGSDDFIRKHAIRKAALELGVPDESALKRKKALQYGSLIDKRFKSIQRSSKN